MPYPYLTPIHSHALQNHNSFFILNALHGNTHPSIIRRKKNMNRVSCVDNHGRRCGADRRQFSYAMHIPERRMDDNRRDMSDRRNKPRP